MLIDIVSKLNDLLIYQVLTLIFFLYFKASRGYSAKINHYPRSYVYHRQYYPVKSYHEPEHYENHYQHHQPKVYNFKPEPYAHSGYEIKYPTTPEYKHKNEDHDSVKFSFEIPMKKIFDKGIEKEMDEHIKGISGHGGDEHSEHGYADGGYGDKKDDEDDKKEFDIKIPKFDVDGLFDKIKKKI